MGWKDFFKKKEDTGPSILENLTLKNMQVGFFLDYDLKTWKVTGRHTYDWGDGDLTYEWQLQSSDDIIYLEQESDDEEDWSISRKIPFGKIGGGVKAHIIEHGDPPEQIMFEGAEYFLDTFGGGKFLKDGKGPEKPLLKWDYVNDSGDKYLCIEQWGEEDFEASVGMPVEEYQFTNILPGGATP